MQKRNQDIDDVRRELYRQHIWECDSPKRCNICEEHMKEEAQLANAI